MDAIDWTPMAGIAFLVILTWSLALFYYRYFKPSPGLKADSFCVRHVGFFIIQFLLVIFLFKFISEGFAQPTGSAAPSDPSSGLPGSNRLVGFGFLALLALVLWGVFVREISRFIFQFGNFSLNARLIIKVVIGFLVMAMIVAQMFSRNQILNNVYMFFVIFLVAELAFVLSRSAFAALFGAIMLADIYLVWLAVGSGDSDGVKVSWYVKMFYSDFMRHFPFPLGFRWGERMLGNGDILFMCLAVVYTKRLLSLRAAIAAGLIMTVPLLLLPLVYKLFSRVPIAWPYTIFIAPVALAVVLIAWRRSVKVCP